MRNLLTTTIAALCLIATIHSAEATENRALKPTNNPQTEHRIALVIGNSAYINSPLKNPVNDAKDVAAKLRGLGFEVIERNNLQTKQIGGTLREFRSKLTPGAVALVFYAGHGLQIKGINYLPSVDADINSEEDAPNQSLSMNQIMDVLEESKSRLNLIFLDACRNNPYARSFRSGDKGLARVSAPSGTLISYSTRPGSVAADGSGRNGLYTSKLLAQMESNQQIELLLKRVVTEVKAASQGKQEPWMEGSIEGDFCFAGCGNGASGVVNIAPAVPAPITNGLSLDDIKKNQAVRGQWDKWQHAMKADFDKVSALNAAPDLQAAAWDRFLASYSQNNPYSSEDETLRTNALGRRHLPIASQQQKAEDTLLTSEQKFAAVLKKANAGDADAQVEVGFMYREGGGVKKSAPKAMEYYLKAATQGNAKAQYQICYMYYHGEGVKKNVRKAIEWGLKAAENGYPYAQYSIAGSYNSGKDGIQKDVVKAAEWYRKAFEGYRKAPDQSDPDTQYMLGVFYSYGLGTPKDELKAADLFQKASVQGNIEAQFQLGWNYKNGSGVQKDFVLAYAWLNLAASQGNEDAVKLRDSSESELSLAEKIESQRLSSNWKKGQILVRERKQAAK